MHGEDVGLAVVMGGIILGGTAIVGGIVTGIVRDYQRQRMVEMVQRERIAMIERGADPEKLPPLTENALIAAFGAGIGDERILASRRRQWLTIWGLIFTFFGLGLGLLLSQVAGDDNVWSVGAIPASVGLALLLGSRVVKVPGEAK
jgi:hypothetical protein